MGEFDFIERLRASFDGIGDPQIVGIGDDAAVIPLEDDVLVVTTDMLVEGVHFLRHATSARELGAKSLAVNLSDVAAMGARPLASFLSVALPVELRGEWAAEFAEGYRELSARYDVKPAGGDTTSSLGPVAINVTVVGRAPAANIKYRSGARPGDIVAVGGPLGESAAGLRDILAGHLDTPLAAKHRNPQAQVAEGEWLGGRLEVHSMMDLSDGLAGDLPHILRASKTAAEIELTAIPTPVDIELAVAGGEDYKLLLTCDPTAWPVLAADFEARFGSPLYPIGRIIPGSPEITWLENGTPVQKKWHGFAHF